MIMISECTVSVVPFWCCYRHTIWTHEALASRNVYMVQNNIYHCVEEHGCINSTQLYLCAHVQVTTTDGMRVIVATYRAEHAFRE